MNSLAQKIRFCKHCGQQLESNSKFVCPECTIKTSKKAFKNFIRKQKMICNEDCLNCTHTDCIREY